MKFIAGLLLMASTGFGATSPLESTKLSGIWEVPQDGTLIKIVIEDGKASGIIISRPGGRVDEVDKYNPRPELRARSIIGLNVLNDLTSVRPGQWKGGHVYDPDSGKTYRAQARLDDPNTLTVRGYIGIPLFGRSATLKRKH